MPDRVNKIIILGVINPHDLETKRYWELDDICFHSDNNGAMV